MKPTANAPRRVMLAYSGGLDTSIIVPWLKETYGCEVVCFCANVGQGNELAGLEERALRIGADQVVVEDLTRDFLTDYVFPALRAGAVYEGRYLLGTSLARPLIAARQVAAARATGCDALAHGCTGKGNDQVRFELTFMALAPDLPVIAPWREWDIVSREDALDYAAQRGIDVVQKVGDIYSRDANLWHVSHEGGCLEDPAQDAPEDLYRMTRPAIDHPDIPGIVTIAFERGTPGGIDGETLDPVDLVSRLNEMAGRHGIGRIDIVESRLVGMKSRGVYETPAGTVLHEALDDLCRLTLPHDLFRTRSELAPKMADLIYNGLWFSPLRRSLQAFVDTALEPATGDVTVELFHGAARAIARRSGNSLYRPDLASFNMSGYDPRHAEGFIRLFGLPLAVHAQVAGGAAIAPGLPANGNGNGNGGPTDGSPAANSDNGDSAGNVAAEPASGRIDYSSIRVPEVNNVH